MRVTRHQEIEAPSFVSREGLHLVRVQKDDPTPHSDYISPLSDMLDEGYSIVGEGRKEAGHSRMVLLGLPEEEYQRRRKESEDQAKAMAQATSANLPKNEWEVNTTGGALTLSQIAEVVKGIETKTP